MATDSYTSDQKQETTLTKGKLGKEDIYMQAIGIVKGEKARWEVATAFVTDRVSFKMRQLIRILRKNYYGIFDQPKDLQTQLEKIWYPLTEINVEAVLKNIDLDEKDINFRAKSPNGYGMTDITRAAVKDKLSRMYFGQKLDDFERALCIDGTAVWKTWEEGGKMKLELVDLLNIYIDPTTPSIQEAYRFTERTLLFPEEIMGMKGWLNTDMVDVNVPEGLPRTDPYWMNRATQVNSNVKMVDVYETWGKIPKSLITGDVKDHNIEVDGHIVVSGVDSPGNERCHLIELNTKKDAENNSMKPYEEAWFTRVPNRWYGRGIAEKLLTLQIYANLVFNFRINRSRISQLGLFKIRKGAGITPQMLSRLPSNGAVVLNNMEDLEQLVVQEVGATSYKDEDVINTISERLTNAFDVVTGEGLPASTSATVGAIQNQNAKSGFSMIKDSLGHFLERWVSRHALPIIAKELTTGEVVRIAANDDSFSDIIDSITMYKAQEALDDHYAKGYIPSPQELQTAIADARRKLASNDTFIHLVQDIMIEELDTQVFVTNEEMDVNVTVQNLINMLNVAPEYKDAIVKETFDLMGLTEPQVNPQPPQAPNLPPQQAMQTAQAVGQGQPAPSGIGQLAGVAQQQQTTAAMTR